MEIKKTALAGMIFCLFSGSSYATLLSCPALSSITQETNRNGFIYKATDLDGSVWEGENPMADESDLQKVHFKESYILNSRNFVACDYVGDHVGIGMRMSLSLKSEATPVGNIWEQQTQPDGSTLPHCFTHNAPDCKFEQK